MHGDRHSSAFDEARRAIDQGLVGHAPPAGNEGSALVSVAVFLGLTVAIVGAASLLGARDSGLETAASDPVVTASVAGASARRADILQHKRVWPWEHAGNAAAGSVRLQAAQ